MSQQLDNSTQLNKIRIYRECLEYELVVDAMISAMPAINRTSEMVSHQPFPYDNEITYRRYKKLKYTPKTAKSMSRSNDYGIFPRYVAEKRGPPLPCFHGSGWDNSRRAGKVDPREY